MSEPLVSVVIATYQRSTDLEQALKSLTTQTYPNIEVVVVDDNGCPEWNRVVCEIVDRIQKSASFSIKLIVNEGNRGSAETRNIGIRAANGMYITFLDDDDVYLPEKIESQLSKMHKAGAEYSLTDLYLYHDKDSQESKPADKRLRSYIESDDPKALMDYHFMYHMTGTDCFMFKKEYLQKIGGFPGIDVGDEFYLMCEAIRGGGKFLYIPECYIKAYIHTGENGGLSSGEQKIRGENALYDYKKAYFGDMSRRTVSYIRMRHYAVLAFAYWRMNKKGRFLTCGIQSFFSAPLSCLKMAFGRNAGRW